MLWCSKPGKAGRRERHRAQGKRRETRVVKLVTRDAVTGRVGGGVTVRSGEGRMKRKEAGRRERTEGRKLKTSQRYQPGCAIFSRASARDVGPAADGNYPLSFSHSDWLPRNMLRGLTCAPFGRRRAFIGALRPKGLVPRASIASDLSVSGPWVVSGLLRRVAQLSLRRCAPCCAECAGTSTGR